MSAARAVGAMLAVAAAHAGAAPPVFVDAAAQCGLTYEHFAPLPEGCASGLASAVCEVERMAGGVAVADVDGDGDADLYVTRVGASDLLMVNNGDGTFSDGTAAAGFAAYAHHSNGATFADIDNDGDADLYVAVIGAAGDSANARNYLYINDGTGHFTESAVARGAAVPSTVDRHLYSVAAGDYDRDGWVDLHTNEWTLLAPSHSRLLRNRGSALPGHFTDVTIAAGVDITGRTAFASSFSDLDDDGFPDLAIAADFGRSRLFWNNGDGTFTDGTESAQVATDENGMGSTIADVDNDGRLDWFVTSIYDPAQTCNVEPCNWGYTGNRLYRNLGGRVFTDSTDFHGVRDGAWGWGAAFFDYDNDGDLDLIMTNGVLFPAVGVDDAFNDDRMRLWENQGDKLVEVGLLAGVTDTGSGKGLAVLDFDDDGDLDVYVVNNAAAPVLYRNDGGNAQSWLRVRLDGRVSNRDGLGAKLTVVDGGRTQRRDMGSVTHFLGQSEYVAHFGLGGPTGSGRTVQLNVVWPSGIAQVVGQAQVERTLTVREPVADCVTGGIVADADGDGWCNALDTCTSVYNPDQVDADGDGYGNRCDADLNNDGVVNAIDVGLFRMRFFSTDPVADFNVDGIVNAADLAVLRAQMYRPPGPGGVDW